MWNLLFNLILFVICQTRWVSAAPTELQMFALTNCSQEDFRSFPDQAFAIELSAEHCNIPELENAIFIRFNKLTTLEITDSKLNTLQDYALNGLNQLRVLSLARNNITQVKSWSNEPMRALISLDLRRNHIRDLNLKSFIRFPNLQRLNLALNQLTDIDDGIFRWMPQLKYLNLGRNMLTTIEARNFHGMNRLTHLYLYYNDIKEIEWMSFQSNTHLRSLRLEGNELNSLEFMIVMNLVRLVHLNLSHNAIESLDRLAFSKDYELRDLDLSHNRLNEVLVGTFAGLESLELLNISHNVIEHIEPQSFDELIRLQHIDLSSNNLTLLPAELFNGSALLQHINISNNALQEIDTRLFVGLSQLRELDLSANVLHSDRFLEHLAPDLARSQLKLNLASNRFALLNMSQLVELKSVELAGNAWSCKWLLQEMLRSPASIHFGKNYSVVPSWSNTQLDISGIDCYDEERKRSIMLLDAAWHKQSKCVSTVTVAPPAPPPLIWPRIRLDKFDSRSVIIWLLIGIVIVFSGMRIARVVMDRKKRRHIAQTLKNDACKAQNVINELEELNACKTVKEQHDKSISR